MVAMSGRVCVLIQLRDPIMVRSFVYSSNCFVGGKATCGIASSGWPEQ